MTETHKSLLQSTNPENIFLGICLMTEEKPTIESMGMVKAAILYLRINHFEFLEDRKYDIADVIEKFAPDHFWAIIDNSFYLSGSLERV